MFESRTIPTRKTKLNAYGEGRVPTAPAVRVQQESTRQNHRYEPDHPAFPARWRYGLYVISPGTGVLAPVSRQRARRVALGISIGMPGPHDFAVRIVLFVRMTIHAAATCAHRIPHSTSVTIAMRPSHRGGTGMDIHDFRKNEREILRAKGRMIGIALKAKPKLMFSSEANPRFEGDPDRAAS
ncbi:hypothetical protein [Bradyrhizobium sp. STM 3557]|uniref:hypothetical protein n=1 Tax=Bradyrhizobium sp. STM 3557 TaxID=578920 RepID=UPI00388D03C5